ncbi:hypothetical protein C0995_003318 [Termitomyces sp. Mi166|nr:hypothetical protein C0995_003318 [Termitomyces sp. Mi166\
MSDGEDDEKEKEDITEISALDSDLITVLINYQHTLKSMVIHKSIASKSAHKHRRNKLVAFVVAASASLAATHAAATQEQHSLLISRYTGKMWLDELLLGMYNHV